VRKTYGSLGRDFHTDFPGSFFLIVLIFLLTGLLTTSSSSTLSSFPNILKLKFEAGHGQINYAAV